MTVIGNVRVGGRLPLCVTIRELSALARCYPECHRPGTANTGRSYFRRKAQAWSLIDEVRLAAQLVRYITVKVTKSVISAVGIWHHAKAVEPA